MRMNFGNIGGITLQHRAMYLDGCWKRAFLPASEDAKSDPGMGPEERVFFTFLLKSIPIDWAIIGGMWLKFTDSRTSRILQASE